MLSFKRKLLRGLIALVLGMMTRSSVDGLEKLRNVKGKAIVASNHLGRLDAGFAFRLVKRDDVIIVVAEKYRDNPIYRWFVKQLDMLWLERFESDLGTLREVLRRLAKGGILLIAPEGTRSTTEALLEGKPGVAYLASKSGAQVIPVAITGSEDRLVKASFGRLRRPKVHIVVGEPFVIPPLPKKNRDLFLREQSDELMSQIAALLPVGNRGVYKDHPRVRELLSSGS
jgi:1-acyl-sn-glycerol-3-phosphate acyltransferase